MWNEHLAIVPYIKCIVFMCKFIQGKFCLLTVTRY